MATTTRRFYANAAPQRTLTGAISSNAASLSVDSPLVGWPTSFPYFAAIDFGLATVEIVLVTGASGQTMSVTRGQDGTSAAAHSGGATIDQVFVRQDADEANAHSAASAGVHGIGGNVVGDTDAQTLTNKTLINPEIDGVISGNALAALLAPFPRGYIGSTAAASSTLTITPGAPAPTEFPLATVNFTLTEQRRVRAHAKIGITPASSNPAHFFAKAGYKTNGGATQLDGTSLAVVTQSTSNIVVEWEYTYLLGPGSYAFFPVCSSTFGSASDQFGYGGMWVYDVGNS